MRRALTLLAVCWARSCGSAGSEWTHTVPSDTAGGDAYAEGEFYGDESGMDDGADLSEAIRVLAGQCEPQQLTLPASGEAVVKVKLVLAEPLAEGESLMLLFSPPIPPGVDPASVMATPNLDIAVEDMDMDLELDPAVASEGKRAVQYGGELRLPQWASPNGVYALSYLMVLNLWGEQRYYDTANLPGWVTLSVGVDGAKRDEVPPELLMIHLPDIVYGPLAVGVDWSLVRNATVVVKDDDAGLTALEGPTFVTGSHLQLRARNAPGTQIVSAHFDQAQALSRDRIPKGSPAARLLEDFPTARVYTLNLSLPTFAWPGHWELIGAHLTDAAGNVATFDRPRVARLTVGGVGGAGGGAEGFNEFLGQTLVSGGGCFRVANHNVTYYGDDLFDYGIDRDLADDYDQFYTDYEGY